MKKAEKIILWDFEGTLVDRPGRWRSTVMEGLDVYEPNHQIDMEQIRPFLRDAFPWHRPDAIHTHLEDPDVWWSWVGEIFTRAYRGVGYELSRAKELSCLVRNSFINPDRFVVFDDTIPALNQLSRKGWKHAILSNHVPELQMIVSELGSFPYFDYCFTSAKTGYEKPNPEAFRNALTVMRNPTDVWMIGDNVVADVTGAESVGLRAILVRNAENIKATYHAQKLSDVISIIEAGE